MHHCYALQLRIMAVRRDTTSTSFIIRWTSTKSACVVLLNFRPAMIMSPLISCRIS